MVLYFEDGEPVWFRDRNGTIVEQQKTSYRQDVATLIKTNKEAWLLLVPTSQKHYSEIGRTTFKDYLELAKAVLMSSR